MLRVMMRGGSSSPAGDVIPSLPGLPWALPGRHLSFIAAFLCTKTPHPIP